MERKFIWLTKKVTSSGSARLMLIPIDAISYVSCNEGYQVKEGESFINFRDDSNIREFIPVESASTIAKLIREA